ncbi:MAG: DinB family protein [Fimbriimonadaceae bacterium]
MERVKTLSKVSAIQNMEMFLRNFSNVPDDKLTWQATPTAKSAIRIAAHTALYAGRFAEMIRNRELPNPENLTEWLAQREAEEIAITCREDIESIFRAGTEEVIAALESLTPEEIESTLDSGQGWSIKMTFLMNLPGWHATLHTGQIDFLQTCWDDQEIYVG